VGITTVLPFFWSSTSSCSFLSFPSSTLFIQDAKAELLKLGILALEVLLLRFDGCEVVPDALNDAALLSYCLFQAVNKLTELAKAIITAFPLR
jgi:hypothetical protein